MSYILQHETSQNWFRVRKKGQSGRRLGSCSSKGRTLKSIKVLSRRKLASNYEKLHVLKYSAEVFNIVVLCNGRQYLDIAVFTSVSLSAHVNRLLY